MELSGILIAGIIVIVLVVGIFTTITNPRDIDQEEGASVAKERKSQDKRRRWWHRH